MYRQERVLRKQMQTEGVELKGGMGMKKEGGKGEIGDEDDEEWWDRGRDRIGKRKDEGQV